MDNEALSDMKKAILKHKLKYQLTPSHMHRINAAYNRPSVPLRIVSFGSQYYRSYISSCWMGSVVATSWINGESASFFKWQALQRLKLVLCFTMLKQWYQSGIFSSSWDICNLQLPWGLTTRQLMHLSIEKCATRNPKLGIFVSGGWKTRLLNSISLFFGQGHQ